MLKKILPKHSALETVPFQNWPEDIDVYLIINNILIKIKTIYIYFKTLVMDGYKKGKLYQPLLMYRCTT